MHYPLTLSHSLERAGKFFSKTEIVSRRPDHTLHRFTYADLDWRARVLWRKPCGKRAWSAAIVWRPWVAVRISFGRRSGQCRVSGRC
jgi:hypothetical protein